jgi:uncharacterized protein YndB with AHSA1/START domain
MKYLLRLSLAFALVVGTLLAASLFLPRQYRVLRTTTIDAPPGRVFPLVADLGRWREWNVWLTRDPAIELELTPATAGAGARLAWRSARQGSGRIEFTNLVPEERVEYRMAVDGMPVQSAGVLRVVGAAGGRQTILTWTSEGALGWSPLTRWFGLVLGPLMAPDMEQGLAALKMLNETAPK